MRSQGVHDNAVVGYKSRFPLEIRSISVLMCSTACYATPRGARQRSCRLQISFPARNTKYQCFNVFNSLLCDSKGCTTTRLAQRGWRSQISFPARNTKYQCFNVFNSLLCDSKGGTTTRLAITNIVSRCKFNVSTGNYVKRATIYMHAVARLSDKQIF